MNNKIIIIILIIAAIMLIMEASLLLSALFLFAKNEKESNKIEEKKVIISEDKKAKKDKENEKNEENKIWNIEFPTLKIKANIEEGWENNTINNSIGHMKSNDKMDEAIVLKSMINDHNKYFERISELKIGDQIIYQYDKKINKYIIVENKIIINEREKIKISNKEQIILLTNVKDLPKVSRCVIGQIIN